MSFYSRRVLPHLINCACGARPIARERAKIAPLARGVVLELGFGSGRNLPFYDGAKVERLYALEPEPGMIALGERTARAAAFPVTILPETAEALSLAPASVDTVLVTYTLCTIPDGAAALAAARRALKPDGRLLFCEHGVAPDVRVRRVQRRLEPMWRRIAGGCHLTRDIPRLVEDGGFRIEEMWKGYLRNTPAFAGYTYRGAARPAF